MGITLKPGFLQSGDFKDYLKQNGGHDHLYISSSFSAADKGGIAFSAASNRIHLYKVGVISPTMKSYLYSEIMSCSFSVVNTVGKAVGSGVGWNGASNHFAAAATNAKVKSDAQKQTGLTVQTRDIEQPLWFIAMDRKEQAKWKVLFDKTGISFI